MIKLTEVITDPMQYDPAAKQRTTSYSLRTFYVNPKFIISMMDNEKFNSLHKSEPVVAKLMPETKFTRLAVASGAHGASYYDVLGTPEQNLTKIAGE